MKLEGFLIHIAEAAQLATPGDPHACAIARLVDPDASLCVSIVDAAAAAVELEDYTGVNVDIYFAHGLLAGFDGEEWYEAENAADANGYALGCRLRLEVRP